ncbi:MAG: type I-C CRISPR-associated protein Cas8c/Csd1 [Proteobacteria bacterium]|nr:type I-C CRISPR-associated protein Cas8c/Csd1 [Pseudomonadota bacterium]
MFLQSLYEYAQKNRLLENLPLQGRILHALIPVNSDGKLRFDHLVPLTRTDEKGKERPGQERRMPRFPGENNGGKAYFLAENCTAVLGREHSEDIKKGISPGDPILSNPTKGGNPTKAFLHFWNQIEQAYNETNDKRLGALLSFRSIYLIEDNEKIAGNLPFIEVQANKKGNLELMAKTNEGNFLPLKAATLGFSVDGEPLTMENDTDPLRAYWFDKYLGEAFQDDADEASTSALDAQSVCLISGDIGLPIARSHKPKILGVPRLSSGGYIVSFAKEAPAFSSYGNEMGQNAPVSERAAASYVLAVNEFLKQEDNHINIGPISICFWSKVISEVPGQFKSMLNRAYPEQIRNFLLTPFAGITDREVLRRDRLYTVALTGNAGRVVICHWLDQTLDDAVANFKRWWDDLQIVNFYIDFVAEDAGRRPSPLAIQNLARATLRQSKKQKNDKLLPTRIVQLYRSALEGTSLPITMLKPILDEFRSALVKNEEKKPTYPYSQSRFALIKLVLIRNNNKKEEFMPEYQLTDTNDASYNLGCLLAILESLQKRSMRAGKAGSERGVEKPNAGIIERYYGQASTAPALVFPYLLSLSRHHLSKLSKGNEKDKRAANAIEETIINICKKFKPNPEVPGDPPKFPRLLDLERQGRFALGFYQQKAYDIEQARKYKASQGKEGLDIVDIDESNEVDSEPVE